MKWSEHHKALDGLAMRSSPVWAAALSGETVGGTLKRISEERFHEKERVFEGKMFLAEAGGPLVEVGQATVRR